MSNSIIRATSFVHNVLEQKIRKGNIVIDGTMGNGQDTVFLAKLVGIEGKVYSFDIQSIALENTKRNIKDNNVDISTIKLINDSHENLNNYINEQIDVAMFNLGYLPGGDHSIITKPSSTIKAISSAINLLRPNGMISIIIYYGHEGGVKEKEKILDFLEKLPHSELTVMKCDYANHKNNPPLIIFIEKKK